MHFFVLKLDDMVILCLRFDESQSMYAYKSYAFI